MPTQKLDILVCRPQQKGKKLTQMLISEGFKAAHLETFTIRPIHFTLPDNNSVTDIIFTSTYAVEYFFKHGHLDYFKQNQFRVWSIGSATQAALAKLNISAQSPEAYNSEGLLALLKHQDLHARQFIIIKGQGGRELLQKTLSQCTKVTVLECYQRVVVTANILLENLAKLKLATSPKLIIFTNFDGLIAAMPIFEKYRHWRQHAYITVTSQRMLKWAQFREFTKVHLLTMLTDAALCALSHQLIDKD